jgi:superfamily I DNA and RNA helicase
MDKCWWEVDQNEEIQVHKEIQVKMATIYRAKANEGFN